MDLSQALSISASGMNAQTERLVKSVSTDNSPFPQKYDPSNPSADTKGYVSQPNVNSFVEMMDMREAERSYSANLNVMQTSRSMLNRVIDLLK
jgi:flagellar basal-body rod protein FlgC